MGEPWINQSEVDVSSDTGDQRERTHLRLQLMVLRQQEAELSIFTVSLLGSTANNILTSYFSHRAQTASGVISLVQRPTKQ